MFAPYISNSPQVAERLAAKAAAEAELQKIQEQLDSDRPLFLAQIRQWIKDFNITAKEAYPSEVKEDKDFSPEYFYRNPDNGEEWDGKGKRPAFLSGKKKLEKYRIYHATGTQYAAVNKPLAEHVPTVSNADQSASNSEEAANSGVQSNGPMNSVSQIGSSNPNSHFISDVNAG